MKIFWATDIHLTHAYNPKRFAKEANDCDALIISGDISNGSDIKEKLTWLANRIKLPIYFVLGNHDFYYKSFEEVYSIVRKIVSKKPNLCWLNESSFSFDNFGICGHEGWYDCLTGDKDRVRLYDFSLIADFIELGPATCPLPKAICDKCLELANNAANHAEVQIRSLFDKHNKVVFVTHVAPFPESAWYRGKQSSTDYLPFFSSITVGNRLLSLMSKYSDKELLVLCGHSHGSATYQPLPNLKVLTGEATYGSPKIYMEFDECMMKRSTL